MTLEINDNDLNDLINNDLKIEIEIKQEFKNLNDYDLLIFTDGAYGSKKQKAGFGIFIYYLENNNNKEFKKYNNNKIIKKIDSDIFIYDNKTTDLIFYSPIDKNNNINYKCIKDKCEYIALYDHKYCSNHKTDIMIKNVNYTKYTPTNIRAEGFAILYSLIYISNIMNLTNDSNLKLDKIINIKKNISKCEFNKQCNNNFLIVTDSEFWINVITKWQNNWIFNNSIFDKKNTDIIIYINYYLNLLINNNIMIHFKFVKSHADKTIVKSKLSIEQRGNIMADKLAAIAQDNSHFNIKMFK